MDTRPISAIMAIASYQLPVARDYSPPGEMPAPVPAPRDSVQISPEARRRAAEADDVHLWGEVRFDPPHYDDPDLPWEVAHQEWMDLMTRVFGEQESEAEAPAA